MAKIELYIPKLWDLEGGFVNDPDDVGGATNHGVTMDTYEAYCARKGRHKPTIKDLKNLSWEDFKDITDMWYWSRWRADEIKNQSIAELVVDWTYNSGAWGIKKTQEILGLAPDGVVGEKTLKAINGADQQDIFNDIWKAREEYYKDIVVRTPSQKKFLKGWMNRLNSFTFKEEGK